MMRILPAILFDLGGTLWEPVTLAEQERVLVRAGNRLAQLLREWDYRPFPDPSALAQAVHTAACEAAQQAAIKSLLSPDGNTLFAHALEGFGLELPRAACVRLRAEFSGAMAAKRALFPEVLPTLSVLRRAGFRLGIVSDQVWGEGCRLEIGRSNLTPFFQSIVLSCEVGWSKPHPMIFQTALSQLGVDPDQAVMVGDNLRADVQGAQVLGMRAIWKGSRALAPYGDVHPDAIIERVDELLPLILESSPGGMDDLENVH